MPKKDMAKKYRRNPRPGDILIFSSPNDFWLPSHAAKAAKYLTIGESYVVSWVQLRGSWVMLELEVYPNMRLAMDFDSYESARV